MSINFGKLGAVDMYRKLYEICGDFGCQGTTVQIPSEVVNEGDTLKPTEVKEFTLRAVGSYVGMTERNLLLELILASAAVGQKCEDVSIFVSEQSGIQIGAGGGTSIVQKPLLQCEQTNSYVLNRFGCDPDGSTDGKSFMQVTIDEPPKDTSWCEKIFGVLTAGADLVANVPQVATAAGLVSSGLGAISLFCKT